MSNRRNRSVIVACEAVEVRRMFITAEVVGSSQGEDIRVTTNFSTIVVDIDGSSQSYPRVIYDGVSIQASGGADRIYIDSNEDVPVTINAGSGNDEIHLAEASKNLDALFDGVTVLASTGSDGIILHDDNAATGDSYTVNNSRVTRGSFAGVRHNGIAYIRLSSGDGVDTFDVVSTDGANLIINGQAGADILNLNQFANSTATVSFDTTQDFARITSAPGGNLTIAGDAGLLLTTNFSNVEGNVTIGTGFIVETNSQDAGGLGYWRERLRNGTTSATPSLTSSVANSSALNDAIGYAYAQDLGFTTLSGFALNAGDLVLRYTLRGDANLDQTVNFADLVSLAQNYNLASRDWRQGDFDLSRNVNFADLVALAQNYNQSVPAVVTIAAKPARVANQVLAIETPKRRETRVQLA